MIGLRGSESCSNSDWKQGPNSGTDPGYGRWHVAPIVNYDPYGPYCHVHPKTELQQSASPCSDCSSAREKWRQLKSLQQKPQTGSALAISLTLKYAGRVAASLPNQLAKSLDQALQRSSSAGWGVSIVFQANRVDARVHQKKTKPPHTLRERGSLMRQNNCHGNSNCLRFWLKEAANPCKKQ